MKPHKLAVERCPVRPASWPSCCDDSPSTSREPAVLAFLGGYPRRVKGIPGVDWWGLNLDIKQGGHTIEYRDEDPHIRKLFQEQLAKEGAAFNMPDEVYL